MEELEKFDDEWSPAIAGGIWSQRRLTSTA
jgi:hypothetical protein